MNSKEKQIELIQSELNNIPWLVRKYKRLFFELEKTEIESASYYALFKASRRYDETKGYKFSTYADRSIRHEIFQLAKQKGLDTVSLEHPVEGMGNVTIADTFVLNDFSSRLIEHIDNKDKVNEIMSVLTHRERELVTNYFFYELEQHEIAEKLNMHSNSVNRAIRIAKQKIRNNYLH